MGNRGRVRPKGRALLACVPGIVEHGPPANRRSDNGPEFTARVVRQWLGELGVKTLFIAPGSPWENGYNESFNGTFRQELLRREIFYSLQEAKVLIEPWRREYPRPTPQLSGLSTPHS